MTIDEIAGDGSFFTRADLRESLKTSREIERELDIALKPGYIPTLIYKIYLSIKGYV